MRQENSSIETKIPPTFLMTDLKKKDEVLELKISSAGRLSAAVCSIDATRESSRLGRLNYGEPNERNCVTKRVDSMHLCLFATRDIDEGEELLYEYGVKSLPWMQEKRL
ncbi:N-lysine methyltransferase KMT5A-like [Crassostrea virginica]